MPPPVDMRVHRRYNPEGITAYNIVPGLIGIILTMTMVLMTGLAMTRERERGTFENLLATPALPIEVMTGKIMPYILIGLIQVSSCSPRRCWLFEVPMQGKHAAALLRRARFSSPPISRSASPSRRIARNQLQAMQMTFFFFLPSILLSGFMFPFRGMPEWAQWLGSLLPLTHFLVLVRGIMLKGSGIAELWPQIWPIVAVHAGRHRHRPALLQAHPRLMIALAIHGGAGVAPRLPRRKELEYRAGLERALEAGYEMLESGGTSLDAVTVAVVTLEDDPLFNAGRGAVYNAAGRHELDASIMEGATLRAGAVAAVSRIRNPVLAARCVMEKSRHVLLAGKGAEEFSKTHGVSLVGPSYFHTAARLAALKKRLQRHHGTVGAVALDRRGNLAAATSTGGYTGKLPGRVGDSPIIGAGTYADNASCAVSGTGWGEAFIRVALAHEVSARMKHRGETLAQASRAALRQIARIGGDGGLIAIDRRGRIAMPFSSEGMLRAAVGPDGLRTIGVYR